MAASALLLFLRLQLEDGFDLDGDVARERSHADGAAGTDAAVGAPNVGEEFAAAVNNFGVIVEIRGSVDHAEDFDEAADAVERAEFGTERGEDGEADLPGGGLALVEREVAADDAGDE